MLIFVISQRMELTWVIFSPIELFEEFKNQIHGMHSVQKIPRLRWHAYCETECNLFFWHWSLHAKTKCDPLGLIKLAFFFLPYNNAWRHGPSISNTWRHGPIDSQSHMQCFSRLLMKNNSCPTHKSNQRVFIPILPTSQDVMSQNLEVGPKAYGNSKNENSCDESFEIEWISRKKNV